MQQHDEVPQRKPWQTWIFVAATVLNSLVTTESLIDGEYLRALIYASGAGIFGLLAAKADLRGSAWVTPLMYFLLGVGVLAAVLTISGA